jgi:DNA polymerase-1
MKKIYLVDISSLFFRAYFAIRPLSSPSGLPVNAIYGVLSMIIKLLKESKPEHIVFCYDRKEPSFRKEMYTEYKANRSEMPDDLGQQIPYIKKLIELLGLPTLEVPSYEADDLIGTLCVLGIRKQFEVVIVSGDKDFGQLVQPGVILWDTMKDTRLDEKAVIEKWGIPPKKFIDYLALVGDSSDNIPGVDGIGPKGAQKLLEQFGCIEDLYQRIDEIESLKLKEKLLKSKEAAFLSKKLVTIITDVPVEQDMDHYRRKAFKEIELRQLLQELNFKSFERTLFDEAGLNVGTAAKESLVEPARPAAPSQVSMTTSAWEGLSALRPQSAIYFFLKADQLYLLQENQIWSLSQDQTSQLHPLFDKSNQWILRAYNFKEICHFCRAPRETLKTPDCDLMLMAYILKGSDCSDFFKITSSFLMEDIQENAEIPLLLNYLLQLESLLQSELKKVDALFIYEKLDRPLIPILYQMETRGVRLNQKALAEFSAELGGEIKSLEKEIHQLAGEEFNIASPKQLAVILFERLGLQSSKKTKTGYSTDTDVLEKLNHPVAQLILQFRELSKLKSTYVDALPALVDPMTQRLHTHFNQALTTTGRLSSTNPNLQNIPVRTEKGQRVRQAFIAENSKVLLSADYSQIELRILAHMSDDPGLKKAFQENLDIHTATAAEIYSVPLKAVTSELRRAAKAVNFGIAYGQGAFGLAENLGISRGEAQGIIQRYFEKFKRVQDYMDETVKMAYEKGYVETLMGRRRYIHELKGKNPALKKFGERAAINAPIQGTASDLVKKAMIDIVSQVSLPLLLQVHDELIFEGSPEEVEKNKPMILQIMEASAKLSVPLVVNASVGLNWDEAH